MGGDSVKYVMGKMTEWVAGNCKLAAIENAADNPELFRHKKSPLGPDSLKALPSLPHDISSWDEARLRQYIETLGRKHDFYVKLVMDNREALREGAYRDVGRNLEAMITRMLALRNKAKEMLCGRFGKC
jgi:hypothetical protein